MMSDPDNTTEDSAPLRRVWYVLHVKPRTEKRVEGYLIHYGYFHYLPMRKKVVRVQRRKRTTFLPLFPGYVFTRLNPDERLTMLKTNLMVRMIPVDRPRPMIHQLRQVEHALKAKPDLIPAANTFHEGELVRIVSGPFRGLEGVVKRTNKSLSVVLNVEMIGSAIELTISPGDLEISPLQAQRAQAAAQSAG